MDWTAYKKILLDEYREDYPNRTKEEESAFYTAMTWLENEMDLGASKKRIMDALDKKDSRIDGNVRNAFIYGLERMGLVLNELSSVSDRLNDYLPEKIHNEYLKKTLEGVKDLIALNEKLQQENIKLQEEKTKTANILKTWKQLSKPELNAIRRENAYIDLEKQNANLKKEIKELKEFRDKLLYIINVELKS